MLNIESYSKEWYEIRKNKIGASDAPIIMGVSPFTTPYQLWQQKLGISEPIAMNKAMERGHVLEEEAREQVEKLTGKKFPPKVVFHPEYPWMMATLDGLEIEEETFLEIKCPGKKDHDIAKEGKIPEKYFPQLQHQFAVTGLEKAIYYSFDGEDGIYIEIKRDDKYIKSLIKEEIAFLNKIKDFSPPEFIDRDYREMNSIEWDCLSMEWLASSQRLKEEEKKEKALREKLISLCENQNSTGSGIKISRYITKGRIDYPNIPNLKDLDLEPYRKESTVCWRISSRS